jgi:leucyl-tRNA synthetase
VLFDLGKVKHPEPFMKLVHQGMILGQVEYTVYRDKETGEAVDPRDVEEVSQPEAGYVHAKTKRAVVAERKSDTEVEKAGGNFVLKGDPKVRIEALAHKMSKSRGNVVNPDDIVKAHGADVLRLYEMFMGPLEAVKPWQMEQIQGVVRFRDKVWALAQRPMTDAIDEATKRQLHKTIKKVTGDIQSLSYNTAISAMMMLLNHLADLEAVPREAMRAFTLILSPFAPHLGEELWRLLGSPSPLAFASWPQWDEALCIDDQVEMAVQVNGKVRGRVVLSRNASEDEARAAALAAEGVSGFTAGKQVKKFIYVPGKIVNIVVG